MNPLSANISAMRNIFKFKSRAPRSEYWWTVATLFAGVILAAIIDGRFFHEGGEGNALYSLLNVVFMLFYIPWLLASISVTIRRLHDLDMSGWYALIYLLPLGLGFVFMAIICSRKGTPGPNRFGQDPYYVDVFSDVDEFG